MTNKPMLSVERDLIERAVQAIINTSQMQPALDELLDLLDKPACASCNDTGQVDDGELTRSDGGTPYENGPIKCVKDCPSCSKPAAQRQGDPVAWIKKEVIATLKGDDCCYAFGSQSPKGNLVALYTEQPAPVAVVMPDNLLSHRESWLQAMERLVALESEATPPTHDSDEPGYWERELKAMRAMYADIDRLNGVKP